MPDAREDMPVAAPRAAMPLRAVGQAGSKANGRTIRMADAAEVEQLSADGALTSIREFITFGYAVRLLFHRLELCYYVNLYHDGALWRTLSAPELELAEAAFHHLLEQAVRLCESEIRRVQLEAHNDRLSRLIAQSEAQAERLRNDLDRDATHTQMVAEQQHQARRDLAYLESQRATAQAQLNKALRKVGHLKANKDEGLPHLSSR